MKATTALRKIVACLKKYTVIQGGQGAGKTFSVLIIIIDYIFRYKNKRVYIISGELTKMKSNVILDFLKLLKLFGVFSKGTWNETNSKYTASNGSFVKFIGQDKDSGKGTRSDLVYVNEADKCQHDGLTQWFSRTKKVYIDFNPDMEFWAHTEVKQRPDCEYVELTYLDNEYLDQSEIDEILMYKTLGFNEDGTVKNKYWANKWRVYGLGQIGQVEGAIFENWELFSEYPDEEYVRLFGVDWGSIHPSVLSELRFYPNKRIYIKQWFYKPLNQVTADGKTDLTEFIQVIKRHVTDKDLIIADSAGKDKIFELVSHGINAIKCDKTATTNKGSIVDGIDIMQEYRLFIHKDDTETIHEYTTYAWAKDKYSGRPIPVPIDKDNHAIDENRYAIKAYHLYGYSS